MSQKYSEKKNNIGIYEGPAPETKVIVRPIKI